MQNIALISGLIGALISAVFSYWIRSTLDRRSQREAEVRLAYVHFVRVSEIAAFEIIVSSFIKVYCGKDVATGLSSRDGSFEPSHKLSVLIAEEIGKLTPEKLKESPDIATVPLLLKNLLESMSESKMSAEQLSKLPKESVLIYSFFLGYLTELCGILQLWVAFFEDQTVTWVTAERIHDQWLTLQRFFEFSRKLRSTLLLAGAATPDEASVLLKKQIEIYNERIMAKYQHQSKLQAAMLEATTNTVSDDATA